MPADFNRASATLSARCMGGCGFTSLETSVSQCEAPRVCMLGPIRVHNPDSNLASCGRRSPGQRYEACLDIPRLLFQHAFCEKLKIVYTPSERADNRAQCFLPAGYSINAFVRQSKSRWAESVDTVEGRRDSYGATYIRTHTNRRPMKSYTGSFAARGSARAQVTVHRIQCLARYVVVRIAVLSKSMKVRKR